MSANGRRLVGIGNVLLLAAACAGSKCDGGDKPLVGGSPQPTAGAQVVASMKPANQMQSIGEPDKDEQECTFDASAGSCVGYTQLEFKPINSADLKSFVDQIEDDGDWSGPSRKSARKNENGTKSSIYTVTSIRDSKSIPLNKFGGNAGSLVMARIDVKRASNSKDSRFGITQQDVNKYGNTFFVVVTGYSPGSEDATLAGTPIATWKVYGFEKQGGRLGSVGRPGRYVWCKDAHPSEMRKRGAWFSSCEGASIFGVIEDRARKVLGGRSLLIVLSRHFGEKALDTLNEKDLSEGLAQIFNASSGPGAKSVQVSKPEILALLKALADEPSAPAWMTCGIGCCTTGPGL